MRPVGIHRLRAHFRDRESVVCNIRTKTGVR